MRIFILIAAFILGAWGAAPNGGTVAATQDPCSSLAAVIDSAVFDLDATCARSYPGIGQRWRNLVTDPADGAAKTDYNMSRGLTLASEGGDPTFSGGVGYSGAYFSYDGDDSNRLAAAANTAFLRDMHKTTGGSDFWLCFAGRIETGALTAVQSTRIASTGVGISLSVSAAEAVTISQRGDSASTTATSAATISDATDSVFCVSHSHSGNQTRIWVNSTTAEELSHTFNTTTTDASAVFRFSDFNAALEFANGSRAYNFSGGNEHLTDAKAAIIIRVLETRHKKDYTP